MEPDLWQMFAQALQSGAIQPPQGGSSLNQGPSWQDRLLGGPDQMGWGQLGLGTVGTLGNLYMGMQQYGMARDQLRENRRQFDLNYGNQRDMINTRLADRQAARVASNPNAYQSVGEYMDQNRIR